MHQSCFRYLDIPFAQDLELPDFGGKEHVKYPMEKVKQLADWLDGLGIKIGFSEVFKKYPGYEYPNALHLDGYKFDNHVKINFIVNPGSSTMAWWRIKPGKEYRNMTTVVGTGYLWAPKEECDLVVEENLTKPALVNAGMLHSVEHIDTERLCFSFMLLDKNTGKKILWDDAMEIFKGYL
jgi:hypothetical protein